MKRLIIKPAASLGLIMSYRCNISCKYCIYACSPKWKNDWIDTSDAEDLLMKISKILNYGNNSIGFSNGLHLTGGEPFLNYKLLIQLTGTASSCNISPLFTETNCFWAVSDDITKEKLIQLKDAGLKGILISVNPFNIENIAFEKIERAYRIGLKIFGDNIIVYQKFYLDLFHSMGLKGKMAFEDFLDKTGHLDFRRYIELLPMGRAAYLLGSLFRKYDADMFFGQNCSAELSNNHHVHIDNYFNYIPSFCAGITLGNSQDLTGLYKKGLDLEKHPVINALLADIRELFKLGVSYKYLPLESGYISKCHLCVDIRKHLVERGLQFNELRPTEYYSHLMDV